MFCFGFSVQPWHLSTAARHHPMGAECDRTSILRSVWFLAVGGEEVPAFLRGDDVEEAGDAPARSTPRVIAPVASSSRSFVARSAGDTRGTPWRSSPKRVLPAGSARTMSAVRRLQGASAAIATGQNRP